MPLVTVLVIVEVIALAVIVWAVRDLVRSRSRSPHHREDYRAMKYRATGITVKPARS